MRKFKHFVLYVLVSVLVGFSSCSDDDSDGGPITAAPGTVTASIDGSNFQSLEISSSATKSTQGQFVNLTIIGTSQHASGITLNIMGYDGPGTYNFDGSITTGVNIATYSETDVNINNPVNSSTELWQAPYENLNVGSVIITEETASNIKGSFEFDAKNLAGDNSIKSVTSGSFDLNLNVIN